VSGGQNYFLNYSVTQSPLTYKELGRFTTGAGQQTVAITLTSNQQDVLFGEFITDVGDPNVLIIPNGIWHSYVYWTKPTDLSDCEYYFTITKRESGGTETLLFTSDSVKIGWNGNNTTPVETKANGVVPTNILDLTDRLIIRVYVNNNDPLNRLVTFYTEDATYSYVVTTLSTPSGTSGSAGSSGTSGSSGSAGTSGSAGSSGTSGSSGSSGTSGSAGSSGIDGSSGSSGSSGTSGSSGSAGTSGSSGSSGTSGSAGSSGIDGSSGSSGSSGTSGSAGSSGTSGSSGSAGTSGSSGSAGTSGSAGSSGTSGSAGSSGIDGSSGSSGSSGTSGSAGSSGTSKFRFIWKFGYIR